MAKHAYVIMASPKAKKGEKVGKEKQVHPGSRLKKTAIVRMRKVKDDLGSEYIRFRIVRKEIS